METYAIGDIHGCWKTLVSLLDDLPYDWRCDQLWLVGDLVNRGPDSLSVLRWARDLAERAAGRLQVVLGNHDLHLLGVWHGCRASRPDDQLQQVLEAPDCDEILVWLRSRPVAVRAPLGDAGQFLLVHAGLSPLWQPDEVDFRARRLERALSGPDLLTLLSKPRANDQPESEALAETWRDLEAFTRIRMCDETGRPRRFTGPPEEAPPGLIPWFEHPLRRKPSKETVVFGHWAALGARTGSGWRSLDSGVAWGGDLTAVRLEDGRLWSTRNRDQPVHRGETRT